MSEWISVKEKMPEEYQDVLLIFDKHMAVGCRAQVYRDGEIVRTWSSYAANAAFSISEEPIYWMPLPEPPKEEAVPRYRRTFEFATLADARKAFCDTRSCSDCPLSFDGDCDFNGDPEHDARIVEELDLEVI